MVNEPDFFQLLVGQLVGERLAAGADQRGRRRGIHFFRDLLGRRERLPGHAVPCAAAMLQYRKYAHMTRASNLSFSTSLAAASLGAPSNNWVCLVRCGK